MGVNTTPDAPQDGQPLTREFLQGPVTALKGPIVPRSSSGVPTARAGSIGTEVYPFSAVYADRVIVGDREISTGGETGTTPGGPGSITAPSTIQNGVVSWKAPAGRPGMCGAVRQAGSSGVVVEASSTDPLVVKLDGTTYTRSSDISGGTLPADFTQSITPPVGGNLISDRFGGSWAQDSTRTTPANADRAKYRYATGAEFQFHDRAATEVLPASYGNNITILSSGGASGTTLTYCQRVSTPDSPSGERNVAKLKMGEVYNTSTTAFTTDTWQLPFHTTHRVIRTGALFVDPLTSTWNITIAPRVVGSVNRVLPTGTFTTGDVVFLEADQRWHRWSGSGWTQTSFVFLAFLAIDAGAVLGVLPVRSENSLSALFDRKFAELGDPISREGIVDGDLIRFGGQSSDVEEKGFAELGGQGANQQGASAVVDTSDAERGTISNDEMFCVYLDIADNNYYFEAVPPIPQIYRQRLLLLHPSRQRLYVGSFVTDSGGALIAEQRINTNANERNRLGEGDDDAFLISNPCLFGRSRLTDVGWTGDRRMQIQIRGRGTLSTGTNTFRYRWRGSSSFWAGDHINKPRWDALFYSYLTPHITEQIEYDTDDPSGATNLVVAFNQWDEASWLYAAGLTEAAREGRAQGTGAGVSGEAGTVALIGAPQLDPASVGGEALAPYSVDIPTIDTNNAGYAGGVLEIAADPQDANLLRLQWGDGTGSGQVPFSVTGDKQDNKFIKSTGPNQNQQEWVFLNYGAIQDAAATEAQIFDNPTQNVGFVGNYTLFEAFNERDRQLDLLWSDWVVSNAVQFASIASTGTINIANTYGAVTLQQRNSSAFNIGTSPITAGDMYVCGTDCEGIPTLSSGTIRGGLLALGSDGIRTWMPCDNPESPDSEEFFIYSAGSWQPIPYNHERLYSHARGLPDDSRWNGMAGHTIGGPTSNVFNDEASMGERNGGVTRLLRLVFSTSTNMFSAVLAAQRFEVQIQDEQITNAMLAPGIDGGKILAGSMLGNRIATGSLSGGRIGVRSIGGDKLQNSSIGPTQLDAVDQAGSPNNTDLVLTRIGGSQTMRWKVAGGSPTFSSDDLFSVSYSNRITNSNNQNLDTGKSFADWDFITVVMASGLSSISDHRYYSAMFPIDGSVGADNEFINAGPLNIDLLSNTSWKITTVAGNMGVMKIRGHKYS